MDKASPGGAEVTSVPTDAVSHALDGALSVPLWLDTPHRPARRAPLDGDATADLVVVGGGFTGLWAALRAAERNPDRSILLLEGGDLGWAASGRNGGFCSASLTHGRANGMSRWPQEMAILERLGRENLNAIEETIARYGIDCAFNRSGELTVAVQEWQADELAQAYAAEVAFESNLELLDGPQTRSLVDSPTYLAALRDPRGTAVLDPAKLVWGLAEAAERAGVRVCERSRVTDLVDAGNRVRVETAHGAVRARQVVLATNAFPSLLRRVRPYIVPVWDHVLATEPLSQAQRDAIGWQGEEGLSDAGNQFHYYRLTSDGRIVFGGYDALYYFGSDMTAKRAHSEHTRQLLATHLLETFPQLQGIKITHTWAGAIDTCTRFTAFWQTAMDAKVVAVQGYTGLGVGASRFGADVCLDVLDGVDSERTRLEMVRRKPLPFPPEPFRWAGIELTRRSIAAADRHQGRRNLWLRALDAAGLGFDS